MYRYTISDPDSVVVISTRHDRALQRRRESALVKNFSRHSFECTPSKCYARVRRENSGKKMVDFPVVR